MYKPFEKLVNKLAKFLLPAVKVDDKVPTYEQTAKQKLVQMDERFIDWIAQAEAADNNYQYDKTQEYVFVRLYSDIAVDITGFNQIDSADNLVKTVGKEEGEAYHVFHVETGRELNKENKSVWV